MQLSTSVQLNDANAHPIISHVSNLEEHFLDFLSKCVVLQVAEERPPIEMSRLPPGWRIFQSRALTSRWPQGSTYLKLAPWYSSRPSDQKEYFRPCHFGGFGISTLMFLLIC